MVRLIRRFTRSANCCVTLQFRSSPSVHHQFTLGALRTPASDATVQRDGGSNLHREHSRLELVSKNSGGTMKSRISLFLLTLALAASSTLTAHASCSNS